MLRRQEYRSNGGGGASSSKKLRMEQPMSKGSSMALREQQQHMRPKHPIKEDSTEDVIESPNVSDHEDNHRHMRQKSKSPIPRDNLLTKQSPLRIANL